MVIYGNLKIKKMITENTTIREFLQTLGTECLRDNLSKNIWAAALFADYVETESIFRGKVIEKHTFPNWCITDMRFPNELEAVVERKGITIRVTRPVEKSKTTARLHPSETSLDKAKFDYEIINDGSIEDLVEKVREILITEKLI